MGTNQSLAGTSKRRQSPDKTPYDNVSSPNHLRRAVDNATELFYTIQDLIPLPLSLLASTRKTPPFARLEIRDGVRDVFAISQFPWSLRSESRDDV